jgi:hypothetical protein
MHVIKGQTVIHTVNERLAYAIDPSKTQNKALVSSYGCDPATAAAEMLLCKREYETVVGRGEEKRSDILLYQIRQSFKPGEVTPEQAQKIGYELAMSFTKGKYQYVVSTHVDHAHIHNHIIYNSTAIDHSGKFRNFKGSSFAIRKISDRLCLEHGLSIIETPQHGHKHYGKWLGDQKPLTWQDKLRLAIDTTIAQKPKDFSTFLKLMENAGYELKQGKWLAFRAKGQHKFTRLRSLGDGYSEEEIRAVITGVKIHTPKPKSHLGKKTQQVNLLVDIQAKLLAGKGAGYERWAKVFNLKQMAQTLNYLTENNLLEYGILVEKAAAATSRYNELSKQIKSTEKRLAEIAVLKTHIVNYSRTRDIYVAYRRAGYSNKFYDGHASDILLHKSAKDAFDALTEKKVPPLKKLQTEYDACLIQKKSIYTEHCKARKEMRSVLTVKANIDQLMDYELSKHYKNIDYSLMR